MFFLRQGFPANFLTVAESRSRGRTAQSGAAPRGHERRAEDHHQSGQLRDAARAPHRHGAQRRLHLHARLQSGLAGQPESAAAERRRQQCAGRACRTRTSGSSSGARRTGSRPTRASISASRSASPGATRSACRTRIGDSKDNTSEQLTTQGSNAFPAELARLQPVVRTERLRRAPPVDDQLRGRPAARRRTSSPGTGWRPASAAWRSGRPYTVNQSGNNVGTNMTGLPNLVGDAEGTRDRRSVVQHRGVPGGPVRHVRQRAPQSASRTDLAERRPDDPAAASSSPIAWPPRCGGTSSTCSTRPTSVCRTGTSPTSAERTRRSAPLRASRATRASCSSRCD